MVKFVAIDAHGLNMLFSGDAIAFVNPYCKKENPSKKSSDTSSFSQQDSVNIQMITLNGHCTSPFQSEVFAWEVQSCIEPIVVFNDYLPFKLRCCYLDSTFQPPRLA